MMNHDSKRPVTVEDLLQLKRAERPAPEFWARFERDLRAKQLAALVEKRPWWRTMPRVFAGFSRYHLPLGATALLAVSFISVRYYQTASLVRPGDASRGVAAISSVAQHEARPAAPVVESKVIASTVAATSGAETGSVSSTAVPATNEPAISPKEVVRVVAMLDGASADSASPSARAIAANRATAQQLEPELANRYLASTHGFEARAMPARTPAAEPLTQVSVSEARRSRLVVAAMPAAYVSSAGASEKVARRISDERLYDTVRRFGASGNQVSMKF